MLISAALFARIFCYSPNIKSLLQDERNISVVCFRSNSQAGLFTKGAMLFFVVKSPRYCLKINKAASH